MKIGILTYHNTNNFGGALQTYALQRSIQKTGADCEVIDYRSEILSNRYKIKRLSEVKSLKELIKYLINSMSEKKTKLNFDKFYKGFLKLSSKSYLKDSISETNGVYDKFIVGSDQVWNLKLSGMDFTYFLDFVLDNKKKTSYAASFGVSNLAEESSFQIGTLLEDFNNISIREPKPSNFPVSNKLININLDPTFLITKEEWALMCKNSKKKKDYILLYTVASNPEIFNFATKLSKKTGYQIIYIHHTHRIRLGMKNIRDIGPQEFLNYIKNAKYVITSSFHGVAFAINFEKDFFYALSNENSNYNSRITNVINLLDLSTREIKKGENNYVDESIEYSEVNIVLKKEVQKSLNYLKEIINKKC